MGNVNAVILMEFSSVSQRVAILTTFRVSVQPVDVIPSNCGWKILFHKKMGGGGGGGGLTH